MRIVSLYGGFITFTFDETSNAPQFEPFWFSIFTLFGRRISLCSMLRISTSYSRRSFRTPIRRRKRWNGSAIIAFTPNDHWSPVDIPATFLARLFNVRGIWCISLHVKSCMWKWQIYIFTILWKVEYSEIIGFACLVMVRNKRSRHIAIARLNVQKLQPCHVGYLYLTGQIL